MDSLSTVYMRLCHYPEVLDYITLRNLHLFIVSAACMKSDIFLAQPSTQGFDSPPLYLPISIQHTLSCITQIPRPLIPKCWLAMRELVWSDAYVMKLNINLHNEFGQHGLERGLGMLAIDSKWASPTCLSAATTIYPPNMTCSTQNCTFTGVMKKAEQRHVILFTLADGAVPAYAVHLYCRRTYLPAFLQGHHDV